MSPMLINTLDSKTLQQLAQFEPPTVPVGDKAERWFGQAAMAVIGVALLTVLVF